MCWRVDAVQKFMDKHPDLAIKFNNIVNRYLVAQINNLSIQVGEGSR
jgi:hypothetical protein